MKLGSEFLRIALLAIAVYCAPFLLCRGQEPASGSPYHPSEIVSGTIRIWGDEYMSAVTKYWAAGFQKYHPEARFETKLMGTATAMPSIYLGMADLALMGRESNTTDNDGFLHVLNYTPLRMELMNGSLDVPGKSYALVIFVHKDNPISQLTLPQLDAIFGCEHLKGLRNIRTWGQLGLGGEWKDKPIQLYGYDAETGTGLFFLHAALANSRKMNWENLREFTDTHNPDGSIYEAGQQIVNALESDRYGVGVSNIRYANDQVKALALASGEGQHYYQATKQTLIARTYPLTRSTYAFVNRPPGKPLGPKIKEFLRYTLSREGQLDILREGGFLPLSADAIREQLKKLE